MGLRATVIKKYEVEYGDTQGFNYEADELAGLLTDFCDDCFVGDDGCGGCDTNPFWEVDKEQFTQMLAEIRDMDAHDFSEDYDLEKGETVRVLEGFLKETPENSLYVRIAWL